MTSDITNAYTAAARIQFFCAPLVKAHVAGVGVHPDMAAKGVEVCSTVLDLFAAGKVTIDLAGLAFNTMAVLSEYDTNEVA